MPIRRSITHALGILVLAALVAGCGGRSGLDADVNPDATVAEGSF
jgi:hypothetical protein